MSGLIRLEQRKTKRFKTIDLTAVDNDPRLSWKAKGIHTYLMSRPPSWEFYYADLLKRATDKRGAIKSGLKELREKGYLVIRRDKDVRGRWAGRTWIVTQDPQKLPIEREAPLFEKQEEERVSSVSRKTVLRENRLTQNQQGSKEQGSKKHNKEKTSAPKPRFPAEDYRQVEKAYSEIKGIEPNGDEWGPIQRDIKLMFKSGNTPQTIINFMRALEDSPLAWTDTWTIKTVRMKLPEWRADKLSLSANGDDRTRALQDDIAEIDRYVASQLNPRLIELGQRDTELGDLTLEEAEEAARLEQLWHEKMEEKERLVQELGK